VAATRAMNMLCVPNSFTSTISQSSATSARSHTGAPVTSVVQLSCSNRSGIGTRPMPANVCERSRCAACRQFTHSTRLALMAALAALSR
jgi:hypothetical protein